MRHGQVNPPKQQMPDCNTETALHEGHRYANTGMP